MNIKKIITISRPHFWIYTFGPFLTIGAIAGLNNFTALLTSKSIFWMLYFLIPANFLIYGINDIFDFETDSINDKKKNYEKVLQKKNHKYVAWINIVLTITALLFLPFKNIPTVITFILFLFFSIFYSAYPIRAKVRPFFDFIFSAFIYILPGVFGFYLFNGQGIPIVGILCGIFWASAMHAFSAAIDIGADQKAGLNTIATKLGFKSTVALCALLYGFSALGTLFIFYPIAIFWGTLYVSVMIYTFKHEEMAFLIYKHFPFMNALCGMSISLYLIWEKLYG